MSDVTTFENPFESSAGGVQRMDVTPVGRERRAWTPEAKARIIAESMQARANVAEIARRNDMLPQQLCAWRREARERMQSGEDTAFVPAVIEELAKVSASSAEIRINVRGVTFLGEVDIEEDGIRVPDGVSADHIEWVLLAVQVATRSSHPGH